MQRFTGNLSLAATYKLHDFQLISLRESGLDPLGAWRDDAIQLHCDAVYLDLQPAEKVSHGKNCGWDISRIAVDDKLHGKWFESDRD
jgi:hypothetical protein